MRYYTDKPLKISQIISFLKERGLLFFDESNAQHILQHISYSRLKGYLTPLMCDKEQHIYKDSVSFEQAYELYVFDSLLRKLISSELETIEISLRTQMAYVMADEVDIYWFADNSNFIAPEIHTNLLFSLENELERCDDEQILRFKTLYGDQYPPAWMTLEVSTFGTLSMIFKNLKPGLTKRKIANTYGLSDVVLSSWLHCLVYIRNICAHHGRLWNKEIRIQPLLPRRTQHPFVSPLIYRKRVYYVLCIIQYLLKTIDPTSKFADNIQKLLTEFPNVNPTAMGFPKDWQREALWL